MEKLKLFLKQLFCKHIYVETGITLMGIQRECDGGEYCHCPTYSNYEYYANKQVCLKCNKVQYEVKRKMII